jgi:hypothetical protein
MLSTTISKSTIKISIFASMGTLVVRNVEWRTEPGFPDENGLLAAHSSLIYCLHVFPHFGFGYSVAFEEMK